MRRLLVLLVMTAGCADAADLTLARVFGDPALAGPAPRAVQISPDGRRVGLLRGRDDDQHQLDFWCYDVRDHTLKQRIDSRSLAPAERLSDAEKARRERARIAGYYGIVSYSWAPDGRHLLFPLGGNLYLYDLDSPPEAALRQLTHGGEAVLDPQLSPQGRYASFVRNQDLWVIDLTTGSERRLTSDGGGAVHNAEAEFIAQEEMHATEGYWWAPDDSSIAYKRYDESRVPIAKRIEVYPERTDVIEQRYPAAGDPNVAVRLGLVAPGGGATRWIDLGADPDIYLARVGWAPDGRRLAYQRLARNQKTLDLVLVDATTLASRTVVTEHSPTWVNLHDDFRFLRRQGAFIWASERSGMKHLYLYGLDGVLQRPLSAGAWNLDELLAVDEHAGLVYVAANKDAITDRQVYALRLDGRDAAAPRRVSQGDGWHVAQFPKDSQRVALYVDSYSDPSTPPQVSIHAPDGRRLAWIEENRLDDSHPYAAFRAAHAVPEFGQFPAEDGQLLSYSVLRPPGFEAARRYPAIVRVYGGPSVQFVTRGWTDLVDQYLARRGYVVFRLDNRGTARRGRAFSDVIAGRLGEVEVRDQLAGVRWLKSQPWVDGAHVGVFGGSYGGYMTLMLLGKGSEAIAAGVAAAPVTDWKLYDTCYTERYLATPAANADGYAKSGVASALAGLRSPLLLVHGMADDNVLFVNSTQLMSELQSRGVQFDLMTYPGGKHGLSTPAMRVHFYTALERFFDRHLRPGDPPAAGAAGR